MMLKQSCTNATIKGNALEDVEEVAVALALAPVLVGAATALGTSLLWPS